jgi:peptidoglycan/xylan/chitin deacetylase (PgdA/CDA1 family)
MKQMSILRKLAGWSTRNRAARRTLTWNEVDELFTSSQMRAGGHTVNHSDLAVISETDQKFEIETDKQILEERTAKQVREFAYPYGSYATKSAATSTILRQAGFDLAFTTSVGGVRRSGDPFLLPRFPVRNWNGDEFSRRLALC